MADYRKRGWYAAVLLCAFAIATGAWSYLRQDSVGPAPPKDEASKSGNGESYSSSSPPIPKLSASPYLNTRPAATYLNSEACAECHAEKSKSFASTAHYLALGLVDLKYEPPDGGFQHAKSGLRYKVTRKDGQLFHLETFVDSQGNNVALNNVPAALVIGSGHHSRSYLMSYDGFLAESPITWYAATQSWKISPGYDSQVHWGFSRPARIGCVRCHAGRVETVGVTSHRLQFHEQKIGCESCHGAGSLHVNARRKSPKFAGEVDFTIVHPGKLSRELNEAICARCHQRSAAFAPVRGRGIGQFRPGLPLTDFRVDYKPEQSDDAMTVVGHFEQMRESRCYTKSKTMTCTSCHDPHVSMKPAEKIGYYRQKCLSCHESDGGCKLPEKPRLQKSPQNDCMQCHMPKTGTDIPHFAFTHHRIGLKHKLTKPDQQPKPDSRLLPMGDLSKFLPIDRLRCLGLAEVEYSEMTAKPVRGIIRERALLRLQRVHNDGLRDAALLGALARLHWERGSNLCVQFAEASLNAADANAVVNTNVLIVLGDWHLRRGEFKLAAGFIRRLTSIRRWPDDWKLLGVCLLRDGDYPNAVSALEKAVAIRRDDPELRQLLADAYETTGQTEKAKKQRALAKQFAKFRQPKSTEEPR